MKKGWRIILGIVLVAVIFGGLCCGVGILTGADADRIILNLDEHFHVMSYINHYSNYILQLFQHFGKIFA